MLVKSAVKSILEEKSSPILCVEHDDTVGDVARMFRERRIGFALVLNNGRNSGSVSERDIIHAIAGHGSDAVGFVVDKISRKQIITCEQDRSLDEVRDIMTEQRTRHVILVDGGKFTGVVSIGDIVKHSLNECRIDSNAMREYISGQGYQ